MIPALIVALLLGSWQQAALPTTGFQRVTGLVTSARTGAALHDAAVAVTSESTGEVLTVRTSPDGRFVFDRVASGPATLTISTIGFIFVRRRIVVPVDRGLDLTVPLAEGTGTYEEAVTITPTIASPAGAVRELSSGALQDLRGVAADDPVRAVQALPGVATGDDLQAEFSVRGSAYRHLGLVIDGVATPLLFHSVRGTEDTGSIAMINTDIVSRAVLRTGAHAGNPGNWLGATLEFDVRDGSRDRLAVRGAVSGTSASAVVEGPLTRGRRGSWLVSVRKSYVDWLLRKLDPEVESTIGFVDMQAKVVYDLTSRQQIQFVALGGNTLYRRPLTTSANQISRATSSSGLLSVAWRLATARALVTQRVSIVTNQFRNRGVYFQEHARGDTRGTIWRGDVTIPAGSWSIDVGGTSEHQRAAMVLRNFQTATASVTRIRAERSTNQSRTISSAWVNTSRQIFGTGVTAGLRSSHDTRTTTTSATPWVLVERTMGRSSLVGGVSRAVQYPSLDTMAAALTPIQPERAWLVDAGVRQALSSTLGVSATAFRRTESNILRRTNENRVVNGIRVTESIFPTLASTLAGRTHGVDVVFERRASSGPTGWLAYTWAHTRHHDTVTDESFDGDFDQRHTFNMFVQQRLSSRMRVAAKFRYGSNVPFVGYFEGDNDALRLGTSRNVSRLPPYARLDLSGSRTFTFARSRLTLFLEIMNVTTRDNYRAVDGGIRSNLTMVEYSEKLIPFLPSAGLLLEF